MTRPVLVVSACLLAALASATDLPPAPEGFAWRAVPAIHASFLTPDGWHFREERDAKTLALFITEKEFTPPEEFEVGATINAFLEDPNAPNKVKDTLDALAAKHATQLKPATSGPFRVLACQFDSAREKDSVAIRTYVLGIANPKTRTAYLVIFESPVSQWERAWEKGKVILDNLALETDT